MLRPEPIAPGGRIRIVSPGLPTLALVPDRARRAEQVLRGLGFDVSYGQHAFAVSDDGIAAGTAAERAADIMNAFADESADAILISDSGLGSRDLLPFLDPAVIALNPKPFIGFCDSVFLHQYLVSRVGMSSFFGCMFMLHLGEAGGPFPETIESFRTALMDDEPLICRPAPTRTVGPIDWYVPEAERQPRARNHPGGWTWVRPGQARGPFLGGEISVLPQVIKDFGLQWDGAVLFWDVAFRNDRPVFPQFEALCHCADLSGLAGMVVGAHPRLEPDAWAAVVSNLARDLLPGSTFPILANADLSHADPSWIVPYGEEVLLDDAEGMIFPRVTATVRP
jgi:muramoyltetrapeptide carboxypeptidase